MNADRIFLSVVFRTNTCVWYILEVGNIDERIKWVFEGLKVQLSLR